MSDLITAAQQALADLKDLQVNHNITYAGTISRLEAALAQEQKRDQAEPICKCDLRTRLVGDGCEVCNPELAAESAQKQAEPVQEPVALVRTWHKGEEQHAELLDWGVGVAALPDGKHTLYTAPPKLVPLTDEELDRIDQSIPRHTELQPAKRLFARAVERALEEKNRGR